MAQHHNQQVICWLISLDNVKMDSLICLMMAVLQEKSFGVLF
jgi:hypothetical protein